MPGAPRNPILANLRRLTPEAERTGVPRSALLQMVRTGRIGHWRIGDRLYVSPEELDEYLAATRVEAVR
jgi:excisionase family DNA binding protein